MCQRGIKQFEIPLISRVMFTAVAQKNLTDAEGYFDEHLAQNDYYAAGEIRPGQWIGAGAERLGLNNAVTRDQFRALCENQNPNNDKRLTQRQEKTNQRRVFYDFTCSAPKSVSVLTVTMDDDRLRRHMKRRHASRFANSKLSPQPRVWKQGNQRDRTTGNLVAAAFTHTSSRALDPLLHTHLPAHNIPPLVRWLLKPLGHPGRYLRKLYRDALAEKFASQEWLDKVLWPPSTGTGALRTARKTQTRCRFRTGILADGRILYASGPAACQSWRPEVAAHAARPASVHNFSVHILAIDGAGPHLCF